MEYICTNESAITVAQMIEILSKYDKDTPIYIMDDNEKERPIFDVGIADKKIIICDF